MAVQVPERLQKILFEARDDPVLFANELLGMPLHDGQKRYIREVIHRGNKKNLLICANRWGKTVTISVLQLWFLFYKRKYNGQEWWEDEETWERAEYRTTNIAPYSSLTEPVFKAIDAILTSKFEIPNGKGGTRHNECKLEWWYMKEKTINTPPYKQQFLNNSYIEHRSLHGMGATPIEGKPYGLITYDEGGRSHHLEDELNGTILARLMDWGGQFHMPSTPDKDSNSVLFHYKLWQDGQIGINDTYAQEGSLRENTLMPESVIEAEYKLYAKNPLGPQRLEGKFIFGGNTLFAVPDLIEISRDELNDGLRPQEGHRYIIGADTAIGRDERVYDVLDWTEKPYKLVRVSAVKGNQMSPQRHMMEFEDLCELYRADGQLQVILETFNEGSARFYLDMPPWIQAITTCYGTWQPDTHMVKINNPSPKSGSKVKKADILIELQKVISAHELLIPSHESSTSEAPTTREQLSIYKEDDVKLPQDRVIALAVAVFRASQLQELAAPEWEAVEW